jgi:hypothetical protein
MAKSGETTASRIIFGIQTANHIPPSHCFNLQLVVELEFLSTPVGKQNPAIPVHDNDGVGKVVDDGYQIEQNTYFI